MPESYIPYGRQMLDNDDINAVIETLKSDWITQGPKIAEFEQAVADRVGAKYAVAVSSGTAALHCACFAADVHAGDEIITSPITFAASGNCALFLGANVKFADIHPDTYCINHESIPATITSRTKAIIPVDFSGQPCDIDEIMGIARQHHLTVIHDAAHSFGASYKNKPVGALADMTILSFHPVKPLTTGEGGMIITNSEKLAQKMRLFRSHGITNQKQDFTLPEQAHDAFNATEPCDDYNTIAPWYYEMQGLGYNYRITDIQCALGLTQLKKLDNFIARRREIAQRYNEALSCSDNIIIPYQKPDRESAWHLYVIQLKLNQLTKNRKQIFNLLRERNIGVHVHYIPLHLQPYYQNKFGYKRGDFPFSETYYDQAITLPLFPSMTDADCQRVIQAVLDVTKN